MRRWTAALLAALLVGGSVALVLGLAAASGVGQRLDVPGRQVGDRAQYAVADANGTPLGELRVEALAPFAARGPDGAWHEVGALRQTFRPAAPEEPEWTLEPWQLAGEADRTDAAASTAPDLAVRLAGGNLTYQSWSNRYNDVVVGVNNDGSDPNVFVAPQEVAYGSPVGPDGGWCGLRNGAQGHAVRPADGIDASGCAMPHLGFAGRATTAGSTAQVFAAAGDEVWLSTGLPYPVKVVTQRPAGLRVLTLTGYEPGQDNGARQPLALPEATALPTVLLAPRTPLGPDPSGLDHPFPLATAIERARANERGAALDGFLTAHPGAQVAEAHYFEQTDTEWAVRTWEVAFVDRAASISISIGAEQQEPGATTAMPVWSVSSPQRDGLQIDDDGPRGPWPSQDLWPTQLPTVASLMARWEAVRDPLFDGKAPTGWSFRIGCADDGCQATDVEVAAGHIRFQTPPDPFLQGPVGLPPGPPVTADSQVLVVDGSGAPLALRSVHRTEEPTDFNLVTVPAGTVPASAVQPARAWELPPAAAFTTGALALAAAIGVLLWPVLKSGGAGAGGAGLFSRTEDSRLLEHKGRAAIVQAIEAEPGVHLRELARRTGQAEGALRHHLRKLEAAGLVVGKPLGGYLCYFVPSAAAAEGHGAQAVARSEGARKVLAAVQGGATGVRAIAASTGLAPSTVAHHLGRLREAGAVPGLARAEPDGAAEPGPA